MCVQLNIFNDPGKDGKAILTGTETGFDGNLLFQLAFGNQATGDSVQLMACFYFRAHKRVTPCSPFYYT